MAAQSAEQQFTDELETFRREASGAAQFVFCELSIHHAAAKSRKTLAAINRTPLFWNTVLAGLQTSGFVTLARVFDQSSPHNVDTVLRLAERNRQNLFSKTALANRKRLQSQNADEWLPEYLEDVCVPTKADLKDLRRRVAAKRLIYNDQFRDIRNKVFAHKEFAEPAQVGTLFAKTKRRDLEKLVVFLGQLHEALWQLLHNGRPLVLRPMPYSAKNIARKKLDEYRSNSVQELIVGDTKRCLRSLRMARLV